MCSEEQYGNKEGEDESGSTERRFVRDEIVTIAIIAVPVSLSSLPSMGTFTIIAMRDHNYHMEARL